MNEHVTRQMLDGSIHASVVIPVGVRYENFKAIVDRLREILPSRVDSYEVIFVDDATGPNTQRKILEMAAQCPECRVIRLKRPMGESTALAIGAKASRGALIITIDPYLHVAIDQLPKLLDALTDDVDLVVAWRFPREEQGLSRIASDVFNTVARWLTRVSVHDLNSRMRVMRRRVLDDLPLYGDLHRFLPILAAKRGYTWKEVQVPQQPGKQEIGAFALQSYVQRLLDLITLAFITRFVKRPLHFFGLIGALNFVGGSLLLLYLGIERMVFDIGLGHRPLLLLAVLLVVVGIQMASIGLLGELLIFTHARQVKDYVVEEDLRGVYDA